MLLLQPPSERVEWFTVTFSLTYNMYTNLSERIDLDILVIKDWGTISKINKNEHSTIVVNALVSKPRAFAAKETVFLFAKTSLSYT